MHILKLKHPFKNGLY